MVGATAGSRHGTMAYLVAVTKACSRAVRVDVVRAGTRDPVTADIAGSRSGAVAYSIAGMKAGWRAAGCERMDNSVSYSTAAKGTPRRYSAAVA